MVSRGQECFLPGLLWQLLLFLRNNAFSTLHFVSAGPLQQYIMVLLQNNQITLITFLTMWFAMDNTFSSLLCCKKFLTKEQPLRSHLFPLGPSSMVIHPSVRVLFSPLLYYFFLLFSFVLCLRLLKDSARIIIKLSNLSFFCAYIFLDIINSVI